MALHLSPSGPPLVCCRERRSHAPLHTAPAPGVASLPSRGGRGTSDKRAGGQCAYARGNCLHVTGTGVKWASAECTRRGCREGRASECPLISHSARPGALAGPSWSESRLRMCSASLACHAIGSTRVAGTGTCPTGLQSPGHRALKARRATSATPFLPYVQPFPSPVNRTAWQDRPERPTKCLKLCALPREGDGAVAESGGQEGAPGVSSIRNSGSVDNKPGAYPEESSGYSDVDIANISVWDSKPAWCQPWTILLTGTIAISGSWGLFHTKWFTAIVGLLIGAWWLTFLVFYPQAYKEAVLESLAEQRGERDL